MAKTWYADSYTSPWELEKHQPLTVTSDFEVKVVRTQVLFLNDPTLTSIQMEIQVDGGPELELHGITPVTSHTSSNTVLKSDISTFKNAVRDIYFTFDDLVLREGESYRINLKLTGYTGTAASHLAWVKGIPAPYETRNYSKVEMGRAPYYIGFIGADV